METRWSGPESGRLCAGQTVGNSDHLAMRLAIKPRKPALMASTHLQFWAPWVGGDVVDEPLEQPGNDTGRPVSAALPIPVIQLLQVPTVALGAPGVTGVIAKVEARLQGRCGPRVLQPYYDLAKLARKESLAPGRRAGSSSPRR